MYQQGKDSYNSNSYQGYGQDYEQAPVQQPMTMDYQDQYESKGLYGDSRRGFIRKVYMILFTQLALTAVLCAISMTSPRFLYWQLTNWWFTMMCSMFAFFICIVIACNYKLMQRVPINYILLFSYTLAMGFMVASICGLTTNIPICTPTECIVIYKNSYIVLAAAGLTAGMVLGLTVYAVTTKTDFTMMGGFLWLSLFTLIFMGMFMGIFAAAGGYEAYRWYNIVYCSLGVIIFGLYLVYDTQLIVGGDNRQFKLGPDDYIIGAMMLYIDIIQIFLYILEILQRVR